MFIKILTFLLVICGFAVSEELMESFSKLILQNIFFFNEAKDVQISNSACTSDMIQTMNAALKGELWAMKMLDASSKIQSGYLQGNILNLGSFDECRSITQDDNIYEIQGKYCLYELIIPLGTTFNVSKFTGNNLPYNYKFLKLAEELNGIPLIESLCIPNSCTMDDLNEFYNNSKLNEHFPMIQPIFDEQYCIPKNRGSNFPLLEMFTSSLIVAVILLVIFCTSYDFYIFQKGKKPVHQILLSFSLYTNTKSLLRVKSVPNQIPCINGLRFISMMWIILGHRYALTAYFYNTNYLYILQTWLKQDRSTIVTGATVSVDTFLVISGCLLIYILQLASARGFNINLFQYYLHRLLRLSPALVMTVLIYMTLLRYMGSGPLWPIVHPIITEPCSHSWWKTLLFIQNYIPFEDICISQTWYLAVDTQLYILAPLLFLPLRRWPRTTIYVTVILTIVSCIAGFIIAWIENADASLAIFSTNCESLYCNTFVRMSPWLIGAILGYILYETRDKNVKINMFVATCLWLLSLIVMSIVIHAMSYFLQAPHNQLASSFYVGFARLSWAFGLSWIIFACCHGYGGLINKFLSMKMFIVLGRLTYSMFLVHVAVIALILTNKKENNSFSDLNNFHGFWGDLAFVVGVSLIWCLLFESPMIAIGKILMPQASTKKVEATNANSEINNFSKV